MSVYLDTSAIYAFLVRSQERHQDVVRAFRKVLGDGWTTAYVVVEAIALLQHRLGLQPVRDFNDELLPWLSLEWVSEELHRRGMHRLLQEDRRRLSLADSVSLEFMRARGLRDALSLDAQFAEAGFRLLPPAASGAS